MGGDPMTEATPQHIDNHKAYVQSWVQAIREKPETLVKSITDAQSSANYMDWMAELITDKEYEQLMVAGELKKDIDTFIGGID